MIFKSFIYFWEAKVIGSDRCWIYIFQELPPAFSEVFQFCDLGVFSFKRHCLCFVYSNALAMHLVTFICVKDLLDQRRETEKVE